MLDNIFYERSNKVNIPAKTIYSNPLYIKRFLSKFDIIKDSSISEGNFEIYDMCIDIELALEMLHLNKLQKQRLELWRLGYKEIEISQKLGITRIAVHRSIVGVCTKVSKQLTGGISI